MEFKNGREFAASLDHADPLRHFREQFIISDPNLIYMDGNSLGRLPRSVPQTVAQVINEEWGKDLIQSWNHGWWDAPTRVGEKVASLVGAAPGQVLVSDTVSTNLFKLCLSSLALRPGRQKIITDTLNFPSDLYVLQGCVKLLGDQQQIIRIGSRDNDVTPDLDRLYDAIDADTALVALSQVVFKSGYLYDVQAITEKAHQMGALVIWDLCHSVGVMPIHLDDWEVDFALGCTYKYLNGGPGSPAFLYVNKRLQEKATSPIWGWWGQNSPFNFDLEYTPADGIKRFQTGTQPLLSLLSLEAALETSLQAGMTAIREKSIQLTEYFTFLFDQVLQPLRFTLGTPRQSARRGSHISLRHPEGYRINRVMIDELSLVPDFRSPDNIRFGLAPLYTTFGEVWEAVDRTRQVVQNRMFEGVPNERRGVT